jgi:hypothetical protein
MPRPPGRLLRRALHEGSRTDNRDVPEGIEHQEVVITGQDDIGAAPFTASSRNLSSVGSGQAAICSVMVTNSAAANNRVSQSRVSGEIKGAR